METFCDPGLIWTWVAVDVFALYFVEKMVACLAAPLALRFMGCTYPEKKFQSCWSV